MSEPSAGSPAGPAGDAADYEYDLAHEWQAPQPPAAERPPGPVRQAVPQTGQAGDYGYDLAHDLPG